MRGSICLNGNLGINNYISRGFSFNNITSLYCNQSKITNLSKVINKVIFERIKIANSCGEKSIQISLKRSFFEDRNNLLSKVSDVYSNLYIKYFYKYFIAEGILILNANINEFNEEVGFLLSWDHDLRDILDVIDKNIYSNAEDLTYFNMLIKYHSELLNSGLIKYSIDSKILLNELQYDFKLKQKEVSKTASSYVKTEILPKINSVKNSKKEYLELSIDSKYIKFDCINYIIGVLNDNNFSSVLLPNNRLKIYISSKNSKVSIFSKLKDKIITNI